MQINRLFEIIYILLDKKTITAKELAIQFEVSSRTIYRDIETLSSIGIPIYTSKGRGGGISLLPEFVLNKAIFTEQEKNDIIASLKALSALNYKESDTALQKLTNFFGESNTNWIEVDFSSWANTARETELFNALKVAIIKKRIVSFFYANAKGEQCIREVEPLKLCFKGSAWYLYGYCKSKNDNRFFKLRRIKKLDISKIFFKRESPQQIFSSKNEFLEEFIKLRLKISSKMAFRVYDEFENYEQKEDGSFIVEIIYPKGAWIFNYLISFGNHCEVLEPEYIKTYMKNELEKILKQYT